MHDSNLNFEPWQRYFEWNNTQLSALDWDDNYQLTQEELRAVKSSVQQFQRGESSEAKHLVKNAKRFVAEHGDKSYYEALLPFIGEEHRHARDLKQFLTQQDIPPIQKHWVDQVFRQLRKRVKLQGSVFILLTAEIVAAEYYPALAKATKSKVLQQICRQIISDEDKHIAFQAALLHFYFTKNSPIKNFFLDLTWRVLVAGTTIVVWWDHGRVFKAADKSFGAYWKSMWKRFRAARQLLRARVNAPEVPCLTNLSTAL